MRAAFRRVPVQSPQTYRDKTFPAPIRGLVLNENLAAAQPGGARLLYNWRPTTSGIQMRGGSRLHATVDDTFEEAVGAMMVYDNGSTREIYAACDGQIFDVTAPGDPEVEPSPELTGLTSDDWYAAQMTTTGGTFLVCVNGSDSMRQYNGTTWNTLPGVSVSISALSQTGGLATATVASTAELLTGMTVTIAGASPAAYNGDKVITVASGTTFTFAIAGGTSSPATGTITYTSSPAITGVATSSLSHVWTYRSRLLFVQENTLDAWYLPVDSIAGTLTKFPLYGVFKKGGSLMFGATWSLDTGDGLDDKCLFVTTNGEAAVYEGSNPADINDWRLVGVYEIGRPLSKDVMKAGGDVMFLTEEGFVPLSLAISKDLAALSMGAISRTIAPLWKTEAARRVGNWRVVKWPARKIAVIGMPTSPPQDIQALVVNLDTGAWSIYTNWDVTAIVESRGSVYFGNSGGKILAAEVGGADDGLPYTCTAVFQFDHMDNPGVMKTIRMARATFTATRTFTPKISASVNYKVSLPAAPSAAPVAEGNDTWDNGLWDQALWDAQGSSMVITRWVSIGKVGFVAGMQVQVTSGSESTTPDAELVSIDTVYETGALVV